MEDEKEIREMQSSDNSKPIEMEKTPMKKKRKSNGEDKEGLANKSPKIVKAKKSRDSSNGSKNGETGIDSNKSDKVPQNLSRFFSDLITKNTPVQASNFVIGFIGFGTMGQEVLKHLMKTEQNIIIWDKNQEILETYRAENVKPSKTVVELIRYSDIIFWCSRNEEAAKDMFYSNFAFRKRIHGKHLINLTNCDSHCMVCIHDTAKAEGAHYLEARLEGSLSDAKEGTLVIYTSGHYDTFKQAKASFKAMARTTYYCNPTPGYATMLSIPARVIAAGSIATVSEALNVAKSSGISITPEELEEVCLGPYSSIPPCVVKAVFSPASSSTHIPPFKTLKDDLESFLFSKLCGSAAPRPKMISAATFKHIDSLMREQNNG